MPVARRPARVCRPRLSRASPRLRHGAARLPQIGRAAPAREARAAKARFQADLPRPARSGRRAGPRTVWLAPPTRPPLTQGKADGWAKRPGAEPARGGGPPTLRRGSASPPRTGPVRTRPLPRGEEFRPYAGLNTACQEQNRNDVALSPSPVWERAGPTGPG